MRIKRHLIWVGVVLSMGFMDGIHLTGPTPPSGRGFHIVPAVLAQSPPRRNPLDQFNITGLIIPRQQILSGGPSKDGIPALSRPKLGAIAQANYLSPHARVIGLTINGLARAYPINVLNWHEVINDELGGVPIAVIYCPLCDSVSVVDRRLDNRLLSFGVSGLLHNSNVLLYDRNDNALWSQIGLTAISGPYVGRSLQHLVWEITQLADWQQKHPESTVVTFNTGHRRDYRKNPYGEYFANQKLSFPITSHDERLPSKMKVVGIKSGNQAWAYPVSRIARARGGRIEEMIEGRRLILQSDSNTGRITVVEAPPEAQVIHTFWFAWAAFHPKTNIYEN